MPKRRRGRHQSTDSAGRKLIARLEAVDGVSAVIIGRSIGGKSIGRTGRVGSFKLQGQVAGGLKGILQTSRGIQELFIRISGNADEVERLIGEKFEG